MGDAGRLDPGAVADRLAAIRASIDGVERAWDHPISIVAVTKGFDDRAIVAAHGAGLTTIGENYAQELLSKHDRIAELGVSVHFIGRLQTNKVRQIAGIVDRWSSLDRPSVIAEVAKRAPGASVLIQVNSTGEEAKGGCDPDVVPELVARSRDLGLSVDGLMTVGPTGRPAEDARPGFVRVRELVDQLDLDVCSMGMTDDLRIALECGSTEVRIGTALFGPRPPR